jgi:glycosyltransferase involved in cell wall biosynthesis
MISIVVPAYNEEEAIAAFIGAFVKEIKLNESYELIIINDGSTDSTESIVRKYVKKHKFIRLVNHNINRGLGKALETGFSNAKGDYIVTMDSDLTHPISFIPKLVTCCKNNNDVCIASRYIQGGGVKNVPRWRIFISKYVNILLGIVFFSHIKDITAGFRIYRAEKIKDIRIRRSGFESQAEIFAYLMKKHCKFKEIPFILKNREIGTSKFNFFKMGPKYVLNLLSLFKYRWSR